jgi:hypothetical protein
MIIYVGATPSMLAALLLLILELGQVEPGANRTHSRSRELSAESQRAGARPLKFGPTWQMLFINFTTSGIGIFMRCA